MAGSGRPAIRLLVVPQRRAALEQALADADGAALKEALESQGWVEVAGERATHFYLQKRA